MKGPTYAATVNRKVIKRSSAPFFSSSKASIWLRMASKWSGAGAELLAAAGASCGAATLLLPRACVVAEEAGTAGGCTATEEVFRAKGLRDASFIACIL